MPSKWWRHGLVIAGLVALAVLVIVLGLQRPGPASANPIGGIASIAAGEYHTCAVTTSGGVKCWGSNLAGQLGTGGGNSAIPVGVSGLTSGVTAIAAGGLHTCALTTAEGVKCWGSSFGGAPVDVPGLTSGVAAISAGYLYTCALTTAGGVKCWGDNSAGQLGTGGGSSSTPADVVGITSGATSVAAAFDHTCAVMSDGSVKCWGSNLYGQLGDGTVLTQTVPVTVLGLGNATAVAAGNTHTCALIAGGAVVCWGFGYGASPVAVTGLSSSVASISSFYLHTCAVTNAGAVKCWGDNVFGQLGDGMICGIVCPTPVAATGLGSGITGVSTGIFYTCAVTTSAGAKCWGINSFGQLGAGTAGDGQTSTTPIDVVVAAPKPTPTPTPCPPGGCPSPTPTATPAPGGELDFSLRVDVDGSELCSTRPGGQTKCSLPPGAGFHVTVSLDSLPADVPVYAAFDAYVNFAGVTSKNRASIVWPDCSFPATSYSSNSIAFGCNIFAGLFSTNYTGPLGTVELNCSQAGSANLRQGQGGSDLVTSNLVSHYATGPDELIINCDAPVPTATHTPLPEPRVAKLPALQNVFLHRQGAKLPPTRCEDGTDAATLDETIMSPITSLDPKGVTGFQQLGAFQFEVRFDPALVCVSIAPGPAWVSAGAFCSAVDGKGLLRYGCVTAGKGHGLNSAVIDQPLAIVSVRPQPELYSQLRPNQDNGIPVQIVNQGCNLADEQGRAIPILSCEDADVTFRYLEGDVDGPDCSVDVFDAQNIAFRWGAAAGSTLYKAFDDLTPSGQINGDGRIDINDLQFVFGRLASTCLDPWPPQPPVNPKS